MKVLQLCHKPPQPTVDGGCIAINTISTGLLNKEVELKILTASTEKHPFKPSDIDPEFLTATNIEAVFLDTRVNIIDAFSALVTSDSYNISRFFSTDFDKKLRELLEQTNYDVVHLESLFMTPYIQTIRSFSTAKVILRSHNLEHLIWERLANSTANKAKRIYLKHLASKLKKYEERTIHEVDGIAAISFEDTNRFEEFDCKVPLITIPFGVGLNRYEPAQLVQTDRLKMFHIGAMNWAPNKEGINWFLDDIWPNLQDLSVELHLAGREMPHYISEQSSDILVVHGEVESAVQFMNSYDVMVVPLLSGSGMRIKIIEAMALGKAVISTSVGAEGIDYVDKNNILIADTDDEFRSAIQYLSDDFERVKTIGANARKLVEDKYANEQIIENLIAFYNASIPTSAV